MIPYLMQRSAVRYPPASYSRARLYFFILPKKNLLRSLKAISRFLIRALIYGSLPFRRRAISVRSYKMAIFCHLSETHLGVRLSHQR